MLGESTDTGPFRDLFEQVDVIAVILDREGLVSFVNAYALAVFGYHRDELVGSSWFELCVPSDERVNVAQGFATNISSGLVSARDENSIINRRGDRVRVRWANTVLRDDAGNVAGTASLGVEALDAEAPSPTRTRDPQLLAAIEADEFRLLYQPIVALIDGAVQGFEALARWNRPDHGWLGPAEFIPRAEASGAIIELGSSLLRQACRQVQVWAALAPAAAAHVSINLSAIQFEDPRLLATVDQIVDETGVQTNRLTFEITESVMLTDPDRAISVMSDLRARGIQISLDDFGTGYSSLSYLVRVPSDVIKLDRSFVSRLGTHPHNDQIAEAIISLGHSLGKSVIAEGIETETQKRRLIELGCERGQGYLFARPLSVQDAEARIYNARSTTRMGRL